MDGARVRSIHRTFFTLVLSALNIARNMCTNGKNHFHEIPNHFYVCRTKCFKPNQFHMNNMTKHTYILLHVFFVCLFHKTTFSAILIVNLNLYSRYSWKTAFSNGFLHTQMNNFKLIPLSNGIFSLKIFIFFDIITEKVIKNYTQLI